MLYLKQQKLKATYFATNLEIKKRNIKLEKFYSR